MLNFGTIKLDKKQICFDVPVPSVTVPNLNITTPSINADVKVNANVGLNFGTPAVSVSTPSVSISTPSLNFSADLGSLIENLKIPTVICITVGGKFDLSSILQQITDSINNLNKINVNASLPNVNLSIPKLSTTIPSLNVKLDVNVNADEVLKQIEAQCAILALDALSSLDPLLALEALLEQFTSLCGQFNFSLLSQVISKIQQAQFQLLTNIIASITNPIQKITKLLDLATQAINAGSQDILNMISSLVNTTIFDSLMNEISSLNSKDALASLNAEMSSQISIGNFSALNPLLNAAQYVNNLGQAVSNIANSTFDSLEDLQNQLQSAVNVGDYVKVQSLLQAYDSFKDSAISDLQNLDPSDLLSEALPLLNNALQSLDLSTYGRILSQLAGQLCTVSTPQIQTSGSINSSIVPNFLQ